MERASKRPRLSSATTPGSATDNVDLQAARAKNDQNLKSIFENIFAKYENDFTDIGDEIDLETGEIVVNNGHIGLITESSLWAQEIGDAEVDDREDFYGSGTEGSTPALEEEDSIPARETNETATETTDPAPTTPTISQLFDNNTDKVADPIWDYPAFDNEKEKSADPIWSFPDFDGKPSTPALKNPPVYATPSYPVIRSASPPGAPDIWALPRPRGRPSTGGVKRYKKTGLPKKRKHRPSALTSDWSFADISEGDDSDDPLNDDHRYQQSPTPKGIVNLRGGQLKPPSQNHGQSYCKYCKRHFSRSGYISHLERAILSNNWKDGHDLTEAKKELASFNGSLHHGHTVSPNPNERTVDVGVLANTNASSNLHFPISTRHDGHGSRVAEMGLAAINGSFNNTEGKHDITEAEDITSDHTTDEGDVTNFEEKPTAANRSTPDGPLKVVAAHNRHDSSTIKSKPKFDEKLPPEIPNGTPAVKKRCRTPIPPDDAKLIIRLRHMGRLQWKQILDFFPGKTLPWLMNWYHSHWTARQRKPPFSKPWSQAESEKLDYLKDKYGLSWADIREELPGRLHTEIEHELLQRYSRKYCSA